MTSRAPIGEPYSWRMWLFRIVAVLVGLFFALNFTAALQPWIPSAPGPPATHPILERWSIPLAAGIDTASALVLLYAAWRPRQAALFLQFFALVIVIFFLANEPFVNAWGIGVIAALPIAAYPWPRQLLVSPWRDGVRRPLFVLALAAGPFLLADAWTELHAQIYRTDELARATTDHASNVEHLLGTWVAMVMATSRRPGRIPLVVMLAAELIYLAAVSFTVPDAPGSWGAIGGALSLFAGLVYVLDLGNELRKRGRRTAPLAGAFENT
jgi:hypothetical protein